MLEWLWKKLEPTYIAGGMSNSAIIVENGLAIPQKLSIELLYDPGIPLLIIYSKN